MSEMLRGNKRVRYFIASLVAISNLFSYAGGFILYGKSILQTSRTTSRLLSFRSNQTESIHTAADMHRNLCLVISNQIVLPGEVTTFYTKEEDMFQECLERDGGIFALAVRISNKDKDNMENLLQVASMCEVERCERTKDEGILLTIKSIGRVRLRSLEQSFPYKRASCSMLYDDPGDLGKGNMVADNIEAFMRKLSSSEESLSLNTGGVNFEEANLLKKYKTAYRDCLEKDSTTHSLRTTELLTAISWAAFTAMDDNLESIENYRIRALDWDNLYERLKLAQYMLREKNLRLSGLRMKTESSSKFPLTDKEVVAPSKHDYQKDIFDDDKSFQ